MSARIVRNPRGQITEIHVLSTDEVNAKRTVRNVESAVSAATGRTIDHRIISVARTRANGSSPPKAPPPEPVQPRLEELRDIIPLPTPPEGMTKTEYAEEIAFDRVTRETDRSRSLRIYVVLTYKGEEYAGESQGIDSSHNRLELVAQATLDALERLIQSQRRTVQKLSLDGVNEVNALGRCFVLAVVHGLSDRETKALSGVAEVEASQEDAVITATLRATERWVTGQL